MDPVLQQWLLNLAIDFPVNLSLLPPVVDGDDSQASALNVRALPGFSFEQAIARLIELAETGLIEFEYHPENGDSRIVAPSAVRPMMISHADAGRNLSFALTSSGAMAWETAGHPRWHELEDHTGAPIFENGAIVGSEWRVCCQDAEHLMASLGWWPMLHYGEHIDLGSIAWRLEKEYEMKYWKRLKDVHVVTFRSFAGGPAMPAWPHGTRPEWFTQWWISHSRWYRQPWELEGWPPQP
jgi:hypothetical protein